MFLGILTMLTALCISAVAIYYSVAGLVAIFASAAVPIMIMGGILEIGKLVTAVWLHYYWNEAKWWLKTYLSLSVIVLMFITSMGIFGFLSKAHIEQTATAQEGLAEIDRIDEEIVRQTAIIKTAQVRIEEAQNSVGKSNDAIQEKIDREQERIDTAYSRIQPAIDEQNAIIEAARTADAKRTEPYEQQLAALEDELKQTVAQAEQYEQRISALTLDVSSIEPIQNQIKIIEDSVALVQSQIASRENSAVRTAQRIIGVEADGRAGPATQRATEVWIAQQQTRISELQSQVIQIRQQAQQTVDVERSRLTALVEKLRGEQTDSIKRRQAEILTAIDQVRSEESPIIKAAREEIRRIRASADMQIAQSNVLIQSLRESITIGKDDRVEAIILEQNQKIILTNNTIDTLTKQKYQIQAEYRKLEAEVGPVKYLAEFIYGTDANKILLEEAVRWVIVIIIFVFDPLAVLLLIASQYTFDIHRKKKYVEPIKEKTSVDTIRYDDVEKNTETTRDDPRSQAGDERNKIVSRLDDRKDEDLAIVPRTGDENGRLDQPEIFLEGDNNGRIQEVAVSTDADVGTDSAEHSVTDSTENVQRLEQNEVQVNDNRQAIDLKKKIQN
jgi:hypothetical protein